MHWQGASRYTTCQCATPLSGTATSFAALCSISCSRGRRSHEKGEEQHCAQHEDWAAARESQPNFCQRFHSRQQFILIPEIAVCRPICRTRQSTKIGQWCPNRNRCCVAILFQVIVHAVIGNWLDYCFFCLIQ